MRKIIVAGISTEVGKTITSAILATALGGDYWKPIQCGSDAFDTTLMKTWLDPHHHCIHPPAYFLKAPLSPHHAARLENLLIDPQKIVPPKTGRPL